MDVVFYCQNCDHVIQANEFGTLYSGRCPKCDSMTGFSTMPKDAIDPFVGATVINDSQLLKEHEDEQ